MESRQRFADFPASVYFTCSYCGGAVLSNSWIKVTKNNELVFSGNSGDNRFKVIIEFVFCLIHIGHGGCIVANDGRELIPIMKWKTHSHEVVIHPFQRAGQLACKWSLDGIAHSGFAFIIECTSAPEKKRHAWALFSQLSFACQPGLTEGGNVDFVLGKFKIDERFVYEVYLCRPGQ